MKYMSAVQFNTSLSVLKSLQKNIARVFRKYQVSEYLDSWSHKEAKESGYTLYLLDGTKTTHRYFRWCNTANSCHVQSNVVSVLLEPVCTASLKPQSAAKIF